MKKITIILSFLVTGVVSGFAQHEIGPALSSQIFSRINYNPAGLGNSSDINIFSQSRMQWVGFDGAPTSTVFNVHYFNEMYRSSLGAAISYDEILYTKAINVKIPYSYNIDLSDKSLLALGLSAGVYQVSADYADALYSNAYGDELINESQVSPDFDFGVEYSTPKFLLGASVSHIGQTSGPLTMTPGQTYYGYARGNFKLNKDIDLIPSILYMNSGQTNVYDISAVAFFRKLYWGGFCYRGGAALTTLIGMEWNFIRIGYGYELSTGETANISSNTHELMLSFIIKAKSDEPQVKGKKKKKK